MDGIGACLYCGAYVPYGEHCTCPADTESASNDVVRAAGGNAFVMRPGDVVSAADMGRADALRAGEHMLDGHLCWCDPELLQDCPLCKGAEFLQPSYEHCAARGSAAPWDPERPLIIVHRHVSIASVARLRAAGDSYGPAAPSAGVSEFPPTARSPSR